MGNGMGFFLYVGLASVPIAGIAWVLMWMTDRLYEWGWVWIIAAPIRIIIFCMQLGVLFTCLATVIGIALLTASLFRSASRGQNINEDSLSVKGYMGLLLLPVTLAIVSLLVSLFHNWLNFGERGLAFITLGYMALVWALAIASLAIPVVWLVILPIFLNNRRPAG